jgi:hypothetical protein
MRVASLTQLILPHLIIVLFVKSTNCEASYYIKLSPPSCYLHRVMCRHSPHKPIHERH